MKFSNAMIGVDPLYWPQLARAAEDAGFHSVAVSDHVLLPDNLESRYPYTDDGVPQFSPEEMWMDPMSVISAMAQTTSTLNFVTNVFVLPMRNPFVVAKSVATAAYLSGGRVELGIGAGWMKEEFQLLEQPFAGRGKRMEEMIEVLRALWSGESVEFHGDFYDFDSLRMLPGIEGSVPVYIGGASEIALRRAAAVGDGWLGMYGMPEELIAQCRTLEQYREDAGTADKPFEIIASPLALPNADLIEELEAAGMTTILTSAWLAGGVKTVDTVDQGVELLATYGERFIR